MDEWMEVFRCTDRALAEQVVDAMLTPAGIPAQVHNRTSSAIPAPDALPGAFFIAVPRDRAEEAAHILKDAQTDGALSVEGDVSL